MYRLFAFLLAFLAAPAAAQPTSVLPDTTLPEVSVVATRAAVPVASAPARVTVLGAEAIDATASRSVADLLEARSAASLRRYGPGGVASLSLRGTGASQTLVLLDGHRIADPQLGQLDLSLLPTGLLERVEVLHGAGSALHGTDGIGGVVNLVSARPETDRLALASTVGAFGERGASGLASIAGRRLGLVVAAEVLDEEGDFPYFDPHAGLTGATARRTGADRTLASAFARLEADLDRTDAHLGLWLGTAERGVPGAVGAPTEARQEDAHARLWGGTATRFGWGTLRASGLVQRARLRYDGDEGRTWLASADVSARVLTGRWLLDAGLTGGLGAAEHPRLAADARETRFGAFVSATGQIGRLLLYPALRADVYLRTAAERSLSALSPRLGANWQPVAEWPLRLKASAGTAFRAPTFNDRFWRYAGTDLGGDLDLRPERGWNADLGAYVERGPLTAEVTLYGLWVRDQIVWRPVGASVHIPENVGRTRTLGLEATARAANLSLAGIPFDGGLTYALTDTRDRSDPASSAYGQPLRYVPRHQLKGFAGAAVGLGRRTSLRLDLDGRFVGARPVSTDGRLRQPAYFVADGQLRLRHAFDFAIATLGLGVENMLDAEYAVIRNYPMPPRHARLRLHLTF